LDLPKKQDTQLEKEGQRHLENRVTKVEKIVGSLELSMAKTSRALNTSLNEKIILDHRFSEISKKVSDFSEKSLPANILAQNNTITSIQSSISNIESWIKSNLSEIDLTKRRLTNRVEHLENDLAQCLTYWEKDIAQERFSESYGSLIWILEILSHSPTYGEVT